MSITLKAEDISIRYITGDFKDIGIKEYATRKLTNNYYVKEFMAVDGISFVLENGDMLGIIGANGAGKSTLLKAVAGIMEPTRGKITANGEMAALLELGSGFDGDLTVRENAYLRGAMLGYTKGFMDETYAQIIDFAELQEFDERPFKQLSSGMKSRLAFSIASLVDPDILILDEVLSVGDGAFQEKSAQKMREIIAGGATTILVSHSLDQIRELCNKVLWLDHGKQIAFGETQEICDRYEQFLRGECPATMEDAVQTEAAPADCAPVQQTESAPAVASSCVKQSFMKVIRHIKQAVKRVSPIACIVLLACTIVFSLQVKTYSDFGCKTITITAPDGDVTFRGIMADGQWYNPKNLDPVGNWEFDASNGTYHAITDAPMTVRLPASAKIDFVFNSGPNEGSVELRKRDNALTFSLHATEEAEYGLAVSFPEANTALWKIYSMIAILITIFFVVGFIGLLFYTKARETINWALAEKVFLLVLLPISILFLLCFSLSSNPLIADFWGYDGAIFEVVGKGWVNGFVPYRDLHEGKGPLCFFIYAAGYLLNPQWGLFAIQSFFLFVSLLFSFFIGKKLAGVSKGMLATFTMLAFFAMIIDEGALVEEFNLPFLMISTYLIIRYFQQHSLCAEHPPRYAFVHGITMAASLCLRLTNGIAIGLFVFCIVVYLLSKRKYQNILQNAGAFLLGFGLLLLPFVLYFAAHGALYDALYGTLLFNFQYAGVKITHTLAEWKLIAIYVSPVILCALFSLNRHSLVKVSMVIACIGLVAWLGISRFYPHYYIIILPFVPVAVGYLTDMPTLKESVSYLYKFTYAAAVLVVSVSILSQIWIAGIGKASWIRDFQVNGANRQYNLSIRSQGALIPVDERDQVIAYGFATRMVFVDGYHTMF